MAPPAWRLLAQYGAVNSSSPLMTTADCPCRFCWCGKCEIQRAPTVVFRSFFSTQERESLIEMLTGDEFISSSKGSDPPILMTSSIPSVSEFDFARRLSPRQSTFIKNHLAKKAAHFVCGNCDISFYNKGLLDKHLLTHANSLPEQRQSCDSSSDRSNTHLVDSFVSSDSPLAQNSRRHTESTIRTGDSSLNNISALSQAPSRREEHTKTRPSISNRSLRFSHQRDSIASLSEFDLQRRLSIMQSSLIVQKNTFNCALCKRKFIRRGNLMIHMRKHGKLLGETCESPVVNLKAFSSLEVSNSETACAPRGHSKDGGSSDNAAPATSKVELDMTPATATNIETEKSGHHKPLIVIADDSATICVNCKKPLFKRQVSKAANSDKQISTKDAEMMFCEGCSSWQVDLPNVVESCEKKSSNHDDDGGRRVSTELKLDRGIIEPGTSAAPQLQQSEQKSNSAISIPDSNDDEDKSDNASAPKSQPREPVDVPSVMNKTSRILTTRKRKKFWCSECGKSFETGLALIRHLKEHNSTQPFKCSLCVTRFDTEEKRNAHLRTHRNQAGNYECNQCEYSCKKPNDMLKHNRIHSGEKHFSCNLCGKAFAQFSSLTSHKRIHSVERPFKCDQCEKAFRQLPGLKAHKQIHSSERSFECEECDMSFANQNTFTRHNKRIHPSARPYKCEKCSKPFSRLLDLKRHQRTHPRSK